MSVYKCVHLHLLICLRTYFPFPVQLKDYPQNQADVVVAKGLPN